MPLYIRDDRVKEFANQVAALQRSTVTDAVRQSLEERLQRFQDEAAQRRSRTDALLARFDAAPDLAPGFTDRDLHDEHGDPAT